jgi:hypothetical protein
MEPTIKGWVWHIPHAPTYSYTQLNLLTLKEIFWYDSTDDLAFVNFTESYEILIPETLIQSSASDIQYVHDNKDRIIKNKEFIIATDFKGSWKIRPYPEKNIDFFTPWNQL